MKRFFIIIVSFMLSLTLFGCTENTSVNKTGVLTGNFEEIFIGTGTEVKSVVRNEKIDDVFTYQNDLIIVHSKEGSVESNITRFHRGIKTWNIGSKKHLEIINKLESSLIIKYKETLNSHDTYAEIDLNNGTMTKLTDEIKYAVSINNSLILFRQDTEPSITTLMLLTDSNLIELADTVNLITVTAIDNQTFYALESTPNDTVKVSVYDTDGVMYGSYEFEDMDYIVQYDTYFYYLDFLTLTVYDFSFTEIIEYEFEYRVGTTITIEGFDDDGVVVEVDRFISKSNRKILYNGDAIVDYRSNNYVLYHPYKAYSISTLYRFENGDMMKLYYEPNQNPGGVLKRVNSDNEDVWSIDIHDSFIRSRVYDDYIRILTTGQIRDYSFDGKLVKIINTKCDEPADLLVTGYTCFFDRLYIYTYENDQIYEKKYLTDAEVFHSTYDYYIVSDLRLNETRNLTYHYYNFYENDGDEIFRSQNHFINQYNIDDKTYVLIGNFGEANQIMSSYSLLEYDEKAEVINEYETYLTSSGFLYVDGPTVVLYKEK